MMLPRRSVLLLGGCALVGGAATLGASVYLAPDAAASAMTPAQALEAAAKGDVLLVDIRRPDEWRTTGIARHAVPIDMRAPDFVPQLNAARTSAGQPIAVICARGVRSARITRMLADAGITPIIDVPEGMLGSFSGPGWLKSGLPVVAYP